MLIGDWSSDVCSSDLFSIERYLTISKASGKSNVNAFIGKIRAHLRSNNIDAAIRECDSQRGSVANVVKSTLFRYKEMEAATQLDVDQRILAIQQEVEESTNLELPMLERSEEHTSELQSLMRISYAVFCLKKRKTKPK